MAQKETQVKTHTRRTKTGTHLVQSHSRTMSVTEMLVKKKNEVVAKYNIKRRKIDLEVYRKKISKLPKEIKEELESFYYGDKHPSIKPASLSYGGKTVNLKQVPANDMALKLMFNTKWKDLDVTVDGKNKKIKRAQLSPMEWKELLRQNMWIVNTSISRLAAKFPIDRDLKQGMQSAGIKAIIEAVDSYGEKYDPKNPENISRTLWSQVNGRVRQAFTKERASLTSSIQLPYQKVKHYGKFSKLYMETLMEPNQMGVIHKKMGLKKKDVYSDLAKTKEGEELLPLEGYTSQKKTETVKKKTAQRDERIEKENESFRSQITLLKNRLEGTVGDEDKLVVSIGVKSINSNIRSMESMLKSKKKSDGTGKDFAQIRHEIKNLKIAKKKLEGSIEPVTLEQHKVEYESLIQSHNNRLSLINEHYNDEIDKTNIGGFKDLYNFMEGLMGGYRPYELDKFVDDEEGNGKLEEIMSIGSDPSPEQNVILRDAHAGNVADFKSYLSFLPDFTKKVIQLHLGIDKHSPLTSEKKKIWGEPITSAKQITEHIEKLIKENKMPSSTFGTGETKTNFDKRVNSWKEKKPDKNKKVKISIAEFKKQEKNYKTLRKKAQVEYKKIYKNAGDMKSSEKAKLMYETYKKYGVSDGDRTLVPKKFLEVPKKSSELKLETVKWIKNKPKRESQGQSREVKVNEQLKLAKKLISTAVPKTVIDKLIGTHRAIQSYNITKANLKDELLKSVRFQAFFNAFNYSMNKVGTDGIPTNTGIGVDYFATDRKGKQIRKTFFPTVDQLITGASVVPMSFTDSTLGKKLDDFLSKKNFPIEKAVCIKKAFYSYSRGELENDKGDKIKTFDELRKYVLTNGK